MTAGYGQPRNSAGDVVIRPARRIACTAVR